MKEVALFMFLCLVINGCSVVAPRGHFSAFTPITPIQRDMTDIQIGQVMSKTFGEAIVTKVDGPEYPGFIAEDSIQLPSIGAKTPTVIPAGTRFKAIYQYQDGTYYCESELKLIVRPTMGRPFNACLGIDTDGRLNGLTGCGYPESMPHTLRDLVNYREVAPDSRTGRRRE